MRVGVIVNNFSNEVEDLLDDFESDDISDSKPISPKEYSSYRGKPRTNNQLSFCSTLFTSLLASPTL